MADYWKSQPRKFCEICKCWMADNKPSRDFHERGKRHQENMKKKLDDMRRKGIEDAKKDREMKSYLAEMERGAMLKFRQDLVDDPKLAVKYGVNAKSLSIPPPSSYLGLSQPFTYNQNKKPAEKAAITPKKKKGEAIYPQPNPNAVPEEATPALHGDWQEVTTDDGHLYYWNGKTGESSWFLPGTQEYDDYIKQMANMPAGQAAAYFQNYQRSHINPDISNPIFPASNETSIDPLRSSSTYYDIPASEVDEASFEPDVHSSLGDQVVKIEIENKEVKSEMVEPLVPGQVKVEEENSGEIYAGLPERKRRRDDTSIYGQWHEVKPPVKTKEIDLQLPESKKIKMCTIVVPKETKFVIKEKTVAVSHKPPVDFKKRSSKSRDCQNRTRNLRQRDCNDDI